MRAITLPKWGLEMSEGTIVAWHVDEGDHVEKGDDLVDIETDKVVNTLDSEASGILRCLIAADGEALPVGALIAVLADPQTSDAEIGDFVANFAPVEASFTDAEPAVPDVADEAPVPGSAQLVGRNAAANASPFARRRADALGIDLASVTGTGRGGRISERDVTAAADAGGASTTASNEPDEAPFKTIPMSATRRTIAQALTRAVQTIPHYSVATDVGADAIVLTYQRLNEASDGARITINDLMIKAAALALGDEPGLNIHVGDAEIRRLHRADICLAIAAADGVIAPVVRDAGALTVAAMATETARLIAAARARTLTRADLDGGTFTISNLGMFGVRHFDAVITPPQGAILTVGVLRREAYEGDTGAVSFRSVLTATLTCDHRAIDGALAARFLAAFRGHIEEPALLK